MTNHDEQQPLPPPPPGYEAEEGAFSSFTRGFRPLGDDLRTLTSTNLGGHTSMDGNAFSRVGNEVGLSAAIRNATQSQLDRVNGLATNTGAMTDAVAQTWTNYETIEDEGDRRMRRAIGDIL
jgi:hypothetical protein